MIQAIGDLAEAVTTMLANKPPGIGCVITGSCLIFCGMYLCLTAKYFEKDAVVVNEKDLSDINASSESASNDEDCMPGVFIVAIGAFTLCWGAHLQSK